MRVPYIYKTKNNVGEKGLSMCQEPHLPSTDRTLLCVVWEWRSYTRHTTVIVLPVIYGLFPDKVDRLDIFPLSGGIPTFFHHDFGHC